MAPEPGRVVAAEWRGARGRGRPAKLLASGGPRGHSSETRAHLNNANAGFQGKNGGSRQLVQPGRAIAVGWIRSHGVTPAARAARLGSAAHAASSRRAIPLHVPAWPRKAGTRREDRPGAVRYSCAATAAYQPAPHSPDRSAARRTLPGLDQLVEKLREPVLQLL